MKLLLNPSTSFTVTALDPQTTSETDTLFNCLIRALNSIYIQAPHIPIAEYTNFVAYSLATYQCLFALLGATFDGHEMAIEWGNYLQSCASHRNNFSPGICQGMMEGFMPSLRTHIGAPRATSNVSKGYVSLDKTTQLPALWTNHDATSESVPQMLPEGLGPEGKTMRWWVGRKKAEWWKFSSCGFDGLPRELRFLDVTR